MNAEQAKKLREPFPPSAIGKLPKAGVMLDYVGHAATTDRLLQVDPTWTWEPMAYDANGAPLIANGGMWIKLTVCGVTRPGFGDGKNPKEIIGDAIRNAAMRFGVALDLWAKEDLTPAEPAPADKPAFEAPAPKGGVKAAQLGQIADLIPKCADAYGKTSAEVTGGLSVYAPFSELSAARAQELIGKLERWLSNAPKLAA